MTRVLSDKEKRDIVDIFNDTENVELTAFMFRVTPWDVLALALLAGQPDRKPPKRAGMTVREAMKQKLFLVARRAA